MSKNQPPAVSIEEDVGSNKVETDIKPKGRPMKDADER